eukprot:516598-Pyramimonas_sp.AAC.1
MTAIRLSRATAATWAPASRGIWPGVVGNRIVALPIRGASSSDLGCEVPRSQEARVAAAPLECQPL